MITIKDVAKRANVSITSASYALNGTGTISEATRQRVLQAAEDLNYHPNAFARHLKKQKTRTLGVFITRFGGSFYEEILEGIHDAVLQTEYELIVCPESRTKRKILTQRQVDGAIVFDSKIQSEVIIKLASKGYPIVVLDRQLDVEYVFPLLLDNQQGVKEAFQHLYAGGARKMFFISGALDSLDNTERMRAFLEEGEHHHIQIPVFNGNFTEESGYAVAKLIIQANDLPDAVFCANDQMAIGFLRAMNEHHLRAPNDIAVIGFDDIQIARYTQPSLTTIGASRFLWGSLAANWLIDFLENGTPFPTYRIPVELIIRESSAKTIQRT
ncbi:MAG TPA: LacI family DNA-binding transcriptional regulator [Anaerolineaceae bacterium]|nr:LacI family DNA-binding transcriptional regulator [Anaerolineaceae bacterium]HQO97592.1 LacI family DNA-binding transcriptional regulator [Anaerolineaceae bacterium]